MSESPLGGDPAGSTSLSEALHQSQEAQAAATIAQARPRPAPTMAYSWKEYNPNARTLYIRNHDEANKELSKLGAGPQALGFDLEWKPTYLKGAGENPVALVQLANSDTTFLLQISAMREFPSKLTEVLANPLIVKTGVAIQSDARKLYIDFGKDMYNCVDLSLLARTVDNDRWEGKYNSSLGLARLIEIYEYRLLPKDKITRSNWEANLNPKQVEYASNDAHAGYILYRKLESMISWLTNPPKSIWYTFSFVSGYLVDAEGFRWQANNPTYDPGPPPPPRPPREPKNTDGAETPLRESEDVSVIAKPAPNFKRKYGGLQDTRERQSDQVNIATPESSGMSVPQSRDHHFNRQRRHQRNNLQSSPIQGSSSQVPLQRPGPNVHHQRTQYHNTPHHPPFVGSSAQTRLPHHVHPPHPQYQKAIPSRPHPPPSPTISPRLQASSAFPTIPPRNVPLNGDLPSDTPYVTIPQAPSGPINPFPKPHVRRPRPRARHFPPDTTKP
ncbi:hypothetical protein M413DRAFT_440097 [Hebeloma cylindrosporum]|uniref:3'-5' exonuclease n=1 Tax=Hebeloma cylindrosporum TaxID=76867 RepID=A0A0C2YF05_HEBCY|nr:hypothetical protein M413DRAFT_440097 [Hebeloma cylindrosporum h7]